MSKHEIEVEGLPEGWEPVAFRMAHNDEHRVINGIIERCDGNDNCESLIVKKKQPRRIAFEETDYANVCDSEEDVKWTFFDGEYWREVKDRVSRNPDGDMDARPNRNDARQMDGGGVVVKIIIKCLDSLILRRIIISWLAITRSQNEREIKMFTLKVFNLNKQVVEIKEFDEENDARIYFHDKYGAVDDFGNLMYFYNLD